MPKSKFDIALASFAGGQVGQVTGSHGVVDPIQGSVDASIDAGIARGTAQAPRRDAANDEETFLRANHWPATVSVTSIGDARLRATRSAKHGSCDAGVVFGIFLGTQLICQCGH